MNLDICDISFKYGSKEILKNISFKASKGEIVGILGHNGCGKTTLLKCINAILKPHIGCISIDDIPEGIFDERSKAVNENGLADVLKMKPKELARSMAVVSQSSFMSFPFTVLDLVMMGRYARSPLTGETREENMRVAYESLKYAGALALADRNTMELSGGEFRRAMIARALAQSPEILLLDEPTLHLDIGYQFALMDLITDLSKNKGMLIIMVTHDMTFAARYCDKIILMDKGIIVDAGTTEEVMTSKNLREIFGIEADVSADSRIPGLNIVMIGRTSSKTDDVGDE